MARREYGGSLTDFTTDKAGLIRRGLDAYFWAARTGGTPLTDIQAVGTAGIFTGNKYTSGTVGAIDILGPDGYDADGIWVSPAPEPTAPRLWLRALDIKGTGSGGGGGGGTVGDATATAKGVIQLTGDLGGTAASPTITKVFTKTDVGLSNVDNTTDAAKPISTATATALAAKADLVGGLVPTAQIPALALTNTVAVTNQAAMLALTATQVQPGDIAVRSDGAGTFVLVATDPSQLSSWLRLNSPTDLVTSVNGQQGTVLLGKTDVGLGSVDNVAAASLRDRATHTGTQAATTITGLAAVATSGTKTDVGLGNVDNTSDANKPVSTAQATAFGLAPTAVKTAAYAVAAGELALMNVTAGATTLTLPATPPDKTRIAARAIGATNTTPLTMTASGADTIGDAGATSATVHLPGETIELQYQAASTRWLATGNVKSLASLDARYPLLGSSGKVAASQLDTAGIAADSALTAAYGQRSDTLRPTAPRTEPITTMLAQACASGHGWVQGGGTASGSTIALNDATPGLIGTQSIAITTNGTGGLARVDKTGIALNYTGKDLVLWLTCDDATKLNGIILYLGNSDFSSYYQWNVERSFDQLTRSGVPTKVTIPWANVSTVGTPDRANLVFARVNVQDRSTGPVTVRFSGLGAQEQPARPACVFTWDDCWGSQVASQRILDRWGQVSTYYAITETVGNAGSLTMADLTRFQEGGSEIACHAFTLAAHNGVGGFTALAADALEAEFAGMKSWAARYGFRGLDHLAWPQGKFNDVGLTLAKKYFTSARSTIQPTKETLPPADPYRIRIFGLDNLTTLAQAKAAVDVAKASNSLVVFTGHKVGATADSLTWTTADVTALSDYVAAQGVPVKTMGAALHF